MKLPDDILPEEQDPQNEELMTLLRRANLNSMIVDPIERTQIILQARDRLFPTDPEVSRYEDITVPDLSDLGSFPNKPKAGTDKPHRGRRLIRLVSALAAVLVVVAFIGSSLLIFGPWSPFHQYGSGTAPPIGPVGAPVVVRTQAHGLELTMKVTPGPYFLSELLEVDVSLTNHTQTTLLGCCPCTNTLRR
jgi:hypothetical protein